MHAVVVSMITMDQPQCHPWMIGERARVAKLRRVKAGREGDLWKLYSPPFMYAVIGVSLAER